MYIISMATQGISSSAGSNVVGAVVLGGGTQSDASLNLTSIGFGAVGIQSPIITTTGIQLLKDETSANKIVDLSINLRETARTTLYKTTVTGADGRLYDSTTGDLVANSAVSTTGDNFGNDVAAREGWNSFVPNVFSRSGVPATGYYS